MRITITSALTGKKALLYEFPGRKGRRKFVPTYKAFAANSRGELFEFSVTRDSSPQVFSDLTNLFGEKGECPPSSEHPYVGVIREDGPVGFRIEFYQNNPEEKLIVSPCGSRRTNIQIHFGAAASYGCILVAGRRREYKQKFELPIRGLLDPDNRIEVTVEPR